VKTFFLKQQNFTYKLNGKTKLLGLYNP